MLRFTFGHNVRIPLGLMLIFSACSHNHQNPTREDSGRAISALTDTSPATHQHGGRYSYNPAKQEYEYTPNDEDIIARHTFIMLGADQTLGYHVSFFESRHQHQVIIKMEFVDAKNGKRFDLSSLPKAKNGFISATVANAPGVPFELYTIGNGGTQEFPVTFFDGIIGSGKAVATIAVNLKVEQIYHFNRLYAIDRNKTSQYMIFKSDGKKPKEYVLAHMIQGLREGNGANYEQLVTATLVTNVDVPDGSILVLTQQDDEVPLAIKQKISGAYFRKGLDEKLSDMQNTLDLIVDKQSHLRDVPIDPGQAKAKKDLGL